MVRAPALAALALALTWAADAEARVDIKPQAEGVQVLDDGAPVLFFRTKTAEPGQPGRLAYIHPLQAPEGMALTQEGAADHPSQRGLAWAWPQLLLNGEVVADGLNLKGVTWFVRATHFKGGVDGSGTLSFDIDWIVSSRPELAYVASETTTILVRPLAHGVRRIEIDTVVTPRLDGLAVAGDAQGRGGLVLSLVQPDRLVFNAGKGAIEPQPGAVSAGPSMGFSWLPDRGAPPVSVGVACRAQGQAVTQWRLSRDGSGQTCVFPGGAPYAITKDRPLRLQATVVVQPRSPAR